MKKTKKCKDTEQDEAIATLSEIDRKHDDQFAIAAFCVGGLALWNVALTLITLAK